MYANYMQIHIKVACFVPLHLLARMLVALYSVRVMSRSVPHVHSQEDTPGWKEGGVCRWMYACGAVCTSVGWRAEVASEGS